MGAQGVPALFSSGHSAVTAHTHQASHAVGHRGVCQMLKNCDWPGCIFRTLPSQIYCMTHTRQVASGISPPRRRDDPPAGAAVPARLPKVVPVLSGKNQAAVDLGKRRWEGKTDEQKREFAASGARARWKR
jgi:hypothetical protein